MKEVISWLNAAIASGKDAAGGMTYYKVNGKTISATNGDITACAPWRWGGKFFVPGQEFEKILNKLPGEPEIIEGENEIKLKSGRFSGTIQTLKLSEWKYEGIDKAKWQKLPKGFVAILTALRPFISEDGVPWAQSIAFDNDWVYATNNMVIAGSACQVGKCQALLPTQAVDFLLSRTDGLIEWTFDAHFMAFRWANGAWMRTQLVVGKFPENAAGLIRKSEKAKPTQKIDDDFREAVGRIGELAEDTMAIFKNRIEAKFGKAVVEDGIKCEIPKGQLCSIFGAKFLIPMLKVAEVWQPSLWPEPVPWRGKNISGFIVGRRQ